MQLIREVTVTIESSELLNLLIMALYTKAHKATGKTITLFSALGSLAGLSDVEAVKAANREADKRNLPRIKTDEFRRWLPQILSETFAEFLEGETNV